jgi:putative transposase
MAGLVCLREGQVGRLWFRTRLHRDRKGERRSFSEDDYIALLDDAHQRLRAPMIVIWDNLNVHVSARMQQLIDARAWLTVVRLPGYAPELNPVEGIWAACKQGLANRLIRTLDDLVDVVKQQLRSLQRRTDLIANVFAHTGLTLEPELSQPI